MQQNLVVIVGPTAVGKSACGVRLAKQIGGEVISGDSVQVYRKLDIGSAKVTTQEQGGIPHHMIDILEPDAEFSVAIFQSMVRGLIRDINSRGKVPILVGGTGLYVRSVLDPYDFPDTEEDKELRTRLQELARTEGKDSVHRRLAEIDPESAERLHPNDLLRVIRALEVYQLTGKKFSRSLISTEYQHPNPYRLSYFGLSGPREWLYDRINRRVDIMFEQGLIQEVQDLLAQGYHPRSNSLKAIGYRHAVLYLRGLLNLAEMCRLLKRDTRHFAKRQLTWFRRDPRIVWYDALDIPLEEIVADMVERICSGGQDSVK